MVSGGTKRVEKPREKEESLSGRIEEEADMALSLFFLFCVAITFSYRYIKILLFIMCKN